MNKCELYSVLCVCVCVTTCVPFDAKGLRLSGSEKQQPDIPSGFGRFSSVIGVPGKFIYDLTLKLCV